MKARPTQARVRAAVLNMLDGRVAGARVADLFCGTGRLGQDALAHGAAEVLFVDVDPRLLRQAAAGAPAGRVRCRRGDVRRIIRTLAGREQFDLIFIDPPYGFGLVAETLARIARAGILAPAGLVVAEHSAREPAAAPDGLRVRQTRAYGSTHVTILEVAS